MTRFSSLSLIVCALLAGGASSSPAQEWAKARLEQSERHREYVPVKHDGRTVNALVIYPEVKDKAPVVVLIHEIFGLTDWMKLQADELAAQGYIVVAPDLVSGLGANGGGTDALSGQDNVIKAVMALDPAQVVAHLDAVADYGQGLPSASGRLFVAGFCWGGGKSFTFATHARTWARRSCSTGRLPPRPTWPGSRLRFMGSTVATTTASRPRCRRPSRT